MMKNVLTFCVVVVMVTGMTAYGATVLHYNFEDGIADTPMNPNPDETDPGLVGSVDISGNDYHMHAWNDYWGPAFSSEGDTPTGMGLSSIYEGYNDGYTLAEGIRAWSPGTWTIELSFKLNITDGWKTLIGRDGMTGIPGDIGPSLQVQSNGIDNAMRLAFATVSDEHYELSSSLIPEPGKWYHLAVVTDGDRLDMYADQLDGNGYQNIGTLIMDPGIDHSLRPTGNWTFGRGWWDGGFVDHIDGNMDDIRFSDEALTPDLFLHSQTARSPDPAQNALNVPTSQTTLSWTNPDDTDICQVYFAINVSEPNQLDYKTVLTLIDTIENPVEQSSATIPESLEEGDVCYWVVDCFRGIAPPAEPNLPGLIWKFTVNDNDTPIVNAGQDQPVWLGMDGTPGEVTVTLDGQVTDDGLPNPPATTTISWTQLAGPSVVIDPNDVENTSVTLTETGEYEFQLWATDSEFDNQDSVTVYVGTDSCQTSHMLPDAPAYSPYDFNLDCIVDIRDFEDIALAWLECTDTLTDCK